MQKKTLLYIGHSYHNKTKSTVFLQDLLKTRYQVTVFDFDPYRDDENVFEKLKGQSFDYVVLFQLPLELKKLKKIIKTKRFVFFPMYDGVEDADFDFWYQYKEAKIVNFSSTLHQKLKSFGLDSFYIQYFPKPPKNFVKGDEKTIYFWHRVGGINLPLVEKLFLNIPIDKIYVHKALDPEQSFVQPEKIPLSKIQYSTWYQDKNEMLKDMQKASIYIAPRVTEGIGMSFLEAMALGKCVIANDKPTMNEYIINGKTGILYQMNHIVPLKPFDAFKIGQAAFEFVQKGYQKWEKEKFNILKFIDSPLQVDKKKLESNQWSTTYFLFNHLELFKIVKKNNVIAVYFLKFILLLTLKIKG